MKVTGATKSGHLRGQLDKVFVPDPAHLACCIILVLGQPELALLANDIEYLDHRSATAQTHQTRRSAPLQQHRSSRGSLLLSLPDQY